ncbi:MAG: response regulator transcription factor [Clostridia bacterium]|nr:response regulator transcription factor [Clostridia bacterium]
MGEMETRTPVTILLVEDDEEMAAVMARDLHEASDRYHILHVGCAADALRQSDAFDCILLDIMLPDMNGIELCSALRLRYSCPLIFISCLDDSDTIIRALGQGGDDYVAKPFDSKVLHARIQANLRRSQTDRKQDYVGDGRDIVLDPKCYTFAWRESLVQLLPIEFRILSYLIEHQGMFFKTKELYFQIWGVDSFGDTRTVIVHIHNIRAKMEKATGQKDMIRNERGRGYAFFPPQ